MGLSGTMTLPQPQGCTYLKGVPMLIGTRLLRMRTGDTDTEVAIRLFMPEENDDTWWCRYEIDWPNGKKAGAAAGADSIQSIFLALQMIGVEIYTSPHHKSGNLTWSAPGQGYGFPVPENVQDLLEGADATPSWRSHIAHFAARDSMRS
jgi:hypothetical protein